VRSVPSVDVFVAGQLVLAGLSYGAASQFAAVPAGSQEVAFRPAGSSGAAGGTVLSFVAGDSVTVLTVDSSSIINPWVLTDTGAVVPSDKSKLRAVHFAPSAPPVDIWRTQPDWQTLITFMFPFNHQAASPYMQSDPGTWTVLVSSEQRQGGIPVLQDTLLFTGPITVPAGESRTVLILDGASGGLQYEVIDP
jgi:hypothetical protein